MNGAAENRDTSEAGAAVPKRSFSSEDEPWDQQPASLNTNNNNNNSNSMRPYDDQDEDLEDGELPSLTPKSTTTTTTAGRVVNGKQTTSRPLNPPSRAGAGVIVKPPPHQTQHRQFWGQLDGDAADDNAADHDDDAEERERPTQYDEDGPDDEMQARHRSRFREKRNTSRQGDETVEGGFDMESGYSTNYTFSTANSVEEQEATFCGSTLTALGDICGGGGSSYNVADSPPKRIRSKSLPKRTLSSAEEEPLEEHTAIEVEFVEQAGGLSPQRKNAYLTAMAKKAKDDFQKQKEEGMVDAREVEVPQEDIYNSFTAAEKRLFLKHINSGVTPSEASQRVMEERRLKEEKDSPGRKNKLRGLAFWKKGSNANSPRSKSVPASEKLGEEPTERVAESSPLETKTAVVTTRAPAVVPVVVPVYAPATNDTENVSRSTVSPVKNASKPSPAVVTPEFDVSRSGSPKRLPASASRSLSPKRSPRSKMVVPAAYVAAADYTQPETDSVDDAALPKSGINYYDAVRREHMDDEEDMMDAPASPKSDRKAARDAAPRGMKFSALRESRSKSAPRTRAAVSPSPTRPPRSAPSRGQAGKQPSFSSIPVSKDDELERMAMGVDDRQLNSAPVIAAVAVSGSRTVRNLVHDERNAVIKQEDADALDQIERDLLRPARATSAAAIPAGALTPQRTAPEAKQAPPPQRVYSDSQPTHDSAGRSSNAPRSGPPIVSANAEAKTTRAPVAPMTAASSNDDHAVQYMQAAAVAAVVVPSAAAIYGARSKSTKKERVEVEGMDLGMDVDIDHYLSSTDAYSVSAGQHDSMSVYTAGTGITQSSRVRRPGAAQARLAKAKQAKKTGGWQETMTAVAASTNRVWDPKQGWIDYEEPESDLLDASNEKIRLDLDKNALRRPKKDEGDGNASTTGGTSVSVPFPQEWERERNEMLGSASGDSSVLAPDPPVTQSRQANTALSGGDMQMQTSASVPTSSQSVASSSKPKGWVESMRIASAALGAGGQKWDPETGWTSPDHETKQTPDVVDFDASAPPMPPPLPQPTPQFEASSTPDTGAVATRTLSPSTVASTRHPPAAQDAAAYYASAEEAAGREPRALAIPVPPRDTDRKLNQWMEKSEKAPKNHSELSTENSDKAVASAGTPTDRYMQLGDNGSVRDQDGRSTSRKTSSGPSVRVPMATPKLEIHDPSESDDDEAPLLQSAGSFPSITDRVTTTAPTVGIVREKVGKEDMDFFAKSSNHSKQKPTNDAGVEASHSAGDEISQSPSRRGAGPVDLDEVDETWESDDEERRSTAWDADSYPMVEPARSDESRSHDSLPTKAVPKLRRNKKDTSPIRGGRANKGAVVPSRGESPGDRPPPRGGPTDQNKIGTSYSNSQEGDSFISAATSESPTVKDRLQQWESRLPEEPPRDEKSPGATAEWKSFLGKKVRAESAAAARQQGALAARDDYKETKEPEGDKFALQRQIASAPSFVSAGGGRHAVETHQDDDSLFEFTSQLAGERSSKSGRDLDSSLERSDLSPIRGNGNENDSDSDDNATSEYGAAEPEKMSFLKRLTECAAPVMSQGNKKQGDSDPMPRAHLAFLRSNPQGSGAKQSSFKFNPPAFCGRPDIIEEDEDAEESVNTARTDEGKDVQPAARKEKVRSQSTPRGGTKAYASEARSTASSVISDDVGSKTAYFEAIAMKAAVAKPRRSDSRRRNRSSAGSSVSVASGSSQQSEKWRAFLDRKKASGASPTQSRASSSTEVSKAAEKYASEKVEEMMAAMATRSASAANGEQAREVSMDWPSVNTSGDSLQYGEQQAKPQKAESVRAAEDLAAARVEAMMAALSNSHLDEGEI